MMYIIPVVGAVLYFISIVADPHENKDKLSGAMFGAGLILIFGESVVWVLSSVR